MQSTQLACPHCGSTLNFGGEIVAGMPVDCLICMRTFVADPMVVETPSSVVSSSIDAAACATMSDTRTNTLEKADGMVPPVGAEAAPVEPQLELAPTPSWPSIEPKVVPMGRPAKAKVAPKDGILVSKPYAPPPGVAVAEKANPAAVAAPLAPSLRRTDAGTGGTIALAVAALGLLLLLIGGVGFAAWKITTVTQIGTPEPPTEKEPIAASDKKPNPNGAADNGNSGKESSSEAGVPAPALTEEEEEDIRLKLQAELRQRLTRAPGSKKGSEISWDPVGTFSVSKQQIVGLDQQRINDAIDKGVKYLKRTQNANGTWHGGHGVGYASIGGLTLLECGVQKNKDMTVQRAAQYVRDHCTNLGSTYELSLAILFLDRLGYDRDRPLIQGMALRLMAGQNDGGGWTYSCPPISSQDMFQLYNFLQSNRKPDLHNPFGKTTTPSGIALNPIRDPNKKLNDPFHELNDLILTKGIEGGNAKSNPDPKKGGLIPPVYTDSPAKDAKKDSKGGKPTMTKTPLKPIPVEALNPNLRNLPVVKNQGVTKKKLPKGRGIAGDNSNTQFAILALWAARRHDVPTDQALLAAYQRFMISQNGDGGWGYIPNHGTTATMTNVGLLGHAMGHGVAPEIVNFNPRNPKDVVFKPALEDPSIQKGLQALARYIGQPSRDEKQTSFPMQNLYLLWSIERVAMLYDLKTIGGKDWYGWGAQILVHNQNTGGEWPTSHYHGNSPALNTCFALLFLKRSNLVQDLTNNLRLDAGIRDP